MQPQKTKIHVTLAIFKHGFHSTVVTGLHYPENVCSLPQETSHVFDAFPHHSLASFWRWSRFFRLCTLFMALHTRLYKPLSSSLAPLPTNGSCTLVRSRVFWGNCTCSIMTGVVLDNIKSYGQLDNKTKQLQQKENTSWTVCTPP